MVEERVSRRYSAVDYTVLQLLLSNDDTPRRLLDHGSDSSSYHLAIFFLFERHSMNKYSSSSMTSKREVEMIMLWC